MGGFSMVHAALNCCWSSFNLDIVCGVATDALCIELHCDDLLVASLYSD